MFEKVGGFFQRFNYLYLISIVMFISAWHVAAVYQLLGTFLPTPLEVVRAFWTLTGETLAGQTLFGFFRDVFLFPIKAVLSFSSKD